MDFFLMSKKLSPLGYVRRSIGFTVEDLATLDRVAKKQDQTRSGMIRQLISDCETRNYPKSA